ncbi:MAG: 3-isopropylmalate dehydrogenase [Peptostreptococcaceae bacterium]|nr:3-isopropylmalate dehydrogenase [Peptostreptococcaceae bacterium]
MKRIAVLPGDGIGPEVTEAAVKAIKKAAVKYNIDISLEYGKIGGIAIDETGSPFPETTEALCQRADAILLGAVGGEKWNDLPSEKRPESGLLSMRKKVGTFANLRPASIMPGMEGASPLAPRIIGDGFDILFVRELTGGIYFGEKGVSLSDDSHIAWDKMSYSEMEIKRIARMAFEEAFKRRKNLVSVDKANVLKSSRLWRQTVENMSKEYPSVKLRHMYVDNAAMQLVINPRQFDVILAPNMFGDILSDEAAAITGSIGLLASASLRADGKGIYEPIHGSAPDIAGKDIANPIAAILSAAMLLRHAFGEEKAASSIEAAVYKVLKEGKRTLDIARENEIPIGTMEMTKEIITRM